MVILIWAGFWPVLWYAFFSHKFATDTPSSNTPTMLRSREIQIGPRIVEDDTVVMMKIDGKMYIGSDKEIDSIVRRLKSTQMTARTMNEVQQLG